MLLFKSCFRCFNGPRLYKVYHGRNDELTTDLYVPNSLEQWPDLVFRMLNTMRPMFLYVVTPIISLYWIFNPSAFISSVETVAKWYPTYSAVFALMYITRGLGRATNREYRDFLQVYHSRGLSEEEYMKKIRLYDFDFNYFPVCYSIEPKLSFWDCYEIFRVNPFKTKVNEHMSLIKRIPIQVLGFISAHTLAVNLMYLGKLGAVQYVFRETILLGRTDLVGRHNGVRSKVRTVDNNDLDVMVVDTRKYERNGDIVVINCEGNSCYYEIGVMRCALRAGYSAIGYNRPGFGFSTGHPYPAQEQRAIEAVVQFAIEACGFDIRNIVLLGWSIGGYAAAYAASCFPEIKYLILDASFGHVLPLGLNMMFDSWAPLVKEVINSYLNLNVAELVAKYDGPIMIIRRLKDEIMSLEPGKLSTNCGNDLLYNVIIQRHPHLRTEECFNIIKYLLTLSEAEREDEIDLAENDTVKELIILMFRYLIDLAGLHGEQLNESVLEYTIGDAEASDAE